MERCKNNEHAWLVISWVFGRYNEEGHFRETQQRDHYAIHAKQLLCQRCLAQADAADLLCIDKFRYLREQQLAAMPIPDNQLEM